MNEKERSCKELLLSGRPVIFSPKGRSMEPMIRGGEATVLVHPLEGEPQIGDILLFSLTDEKLVLHRLVNREGELYLMLGDNSILMERIRRDQILGVASEIYRDGKAICVTDRRCRIYVWFRIRTIWLRRMVYFLKKKWLGIYNEC